MNPKISLSVLLLAGALAASPAVQAQAQQGRGAPAAGGAQELAAIDLTSADVEFLVRASSYYRAFNRAAELALDRSRNPQVRELARQMAEDHGQAAAQLRKLAAAHDVELPRGITPAQRMVLTGLGALRGAAFDRHFLQRAGLNEHRELARLLHAQATSRGTDPALKLFAETMLPRVQRHMARADTLLGRAEARQDARDDLEDGALADARQQVREAVRVVREMKSDPELAQALRRAHGVFILPSYGRAAAGLGVQGGKGVLVTRDGERFGDPVFYRMAGISVGPQAGIAAGDLAFLLMTERAVQEFRSRRNLSLSADGTLTLGTWSGRGHAAAGKLQDVVAWSGTQGAYAGLSVGVHGIRVDADANHAYYGRKATPLQILAGRVHNPHRNLLGAVLGG